MKYGLSGNKLETKRDKIHEVFVRTLLTIFIIGIFLIVFLCSNLY